jgi:hypothetical protein
MSTSVSEPTSNTSEIDQKINDVERRITQTQFKIDKLERENAALLKKISSAGIAEASAYRQQYNQNRDHIMLLKAELKELQSQKAEYLQIKKEAMEDEDVQTDDYYRIPAIMQDLRNAYKLSWNSSGSWSGNTYTRTATMPNINGTITFKANISIARKPKYLLGIKIHRAIVQIQWELTTEYEDSQVVEVMQLDPNMSD